MTGLRRWRKVAKSLVILSFTWEAAVTIVSLVLFILVSVRGGGAPSSDRLIPVVGTLGICGVVIWAIWDARRRRRRQHPERLATAAEEKA
jgi:4-amino-4-deoxy-L-arabinose transferase-like glycosyltransferase